MLAFSIHQLVQELFWHNTKKFGTKLTCETLGIVLTHWKNVKNQNGT